MTAPRTAGAGGGPRRFLLAAAVSRHPKCPDWDRPGLAAALDSTVELFTDTLGYRHHDTLGLDPTRGRLTDRLRAFCKSPDRREDDLVAVYLSGHGDVLGSGEHVLFTADTDPDDISYTALPTVDLARAMLQETAVRRLLLILDTCYSGQGGNELAAAALEGISDRWSHATGSGLVIVSSAQPHQQAVAGTFPHLFAEAVRSLATAGHGPETLAVSTVVQQMNDHPDRPAHQRVSLALVGLTGEPPAFLANPRHSTRLTDVDLAVQQAAEFDEHARRRDTELTTRLLVRAMGYASDASQGWWFYGRPEALSHIAHWLREPAADDAAACRIVTAGPGSGKTAVLGLIAALTHPERRRTVPLNVIDFLPVPEVGAVDVAVYAQNLTDTDVLQGIAAAARLRDAGTVGQLLQALGESGRDRPFTVLIDALDEAATPDTLCSRVLRPLIDNAHGRIRLLLGTRPYLLDRLGFDRASEQVIDLDSPRYADPPALHAYTVRNLLEAHPDSPYRQLPPLLGPVASAVAEAAGTSFLVARITAGTLAAADDVPNPFDPAWLASLPRLPGDAMRADLTRRLGVDAGRATDLLRPLAYAEGQGLPWEDIWAPLASALSGRVYTDDDLLWLRRTAGSYVVEATENGRSAYRLYHQALAEHLRDGTDPAAVHAAFTDVLTARVPYRADATRDWSRTHPYTLAYLASHAAAADRLADVLADPDYLVHAVPRGLTPHLHRARGDSARLTAAVYRTSVGLHATVTPDLRRQVLALDATRAGATALRQRLVDGVADGGWVPDWATGGDFSPGLRDAFDAGIGIVQAVACADLGGVPVVVTGGMDGEMGVWDLTTATPLYEGPRAHEGAAWAVACASVDGVPVAVTAGGDLAVRVWDLASGRVVRELTGHSGAMTGVACTTLDGVPVAVAGGEDSVLRVWDLRSGRAVGGPMAGHAGQVLSVACTSVGGVPVAVTAGSDGVRMWDLASHRSLGALSGLDSVEAVACTNAGGTPIAVTGSKDGTVRVWDLARRRQWGEPLARAGGHVVRVVCTSLAGTPVAVTAGGSDDTVRVWDLVSRRQVGVPLAGHSQGVTALAGTGADDALVVTGGRDGMVRVWDPAPFRPMGEPRPGHSEQVSVLTCTRPGGRPAALTGGREGTLRLWDLASGAPVGEPMAADEGEVQALACAPDGSLAVMVGMRGRAVVWDPAAQRQLTVLPAGTRRPSVPAFAGLDGTTVVVTAHDDATLSVWDPRSGQQLREPLHGHSYLPTGLVCAGHDDVLYALTVGFDGTVEMWNVAAGTPVGTPATPRGVTASAAASTILDGVPVAVTAGDDRAVRLWDLTAGTPLGDPLPGSTGRGLAVACGHLDGIPVVAVAANDQTVRIWNLRTRDPIGLVSVPGVRVVAVGDDGKIVVGLGRDVAAFSRRSHAGPRRPAHRRADT